jgi:hypothetical protein
LRFATSWFRAQGVVALCSCVELMGRRIARKHTTRQLQEKELFGHLPLSVTSLWPIQLCTLLQNVDVFPSPCLSNFCPVFRLIPSGWL